MTAYVPVRCSCPLVKARPGKKVCSHSSFIMRSVRYKREIDFEPRNNLLQARCWSRSGDAENGVTRLKSARTGAGNRREGI